MSASTAPHDDLRGFLTTLWEETLGMEAIGPDENFFDLGGDSMAATSISVGIRKHTGRETPIRLIFDHPTVAELAVALEGDAA
ncbi:phosphopantetheine-binding protein [Streptomyces sp. NPDC057638]|uniref:phosphopantetheine-binding protein n=1 Tax=Streptomyces sp. NPDC057638 TaxID=3346190 RepID=UPI0036BFCE2B